ncbi:MAG: penicillin-binding protein 2 [Acidimicrobiia bacterium]|nr:penicillin-binding protein 2 [Acidimicrobiia bacterium]
MARKSGPRFGSLDFRLILLAFFFIVAWGAIGFRLFQVQVVRADEYAEQARSQRVTVRELAPDRGTIFDREGRELAVTIDATTVYANPQQIVDANVTATLVGGLLGVDIGELEAALEGERSFVFVARQLEWQLAQQIRDLELPGIHFVSEPKRVYPAGSLAAHVVGFVDIDSNGIEGLEQKYNTLLTGSPGELLVEHDVAGRVIPQGEYDLTPAEPGTDLITSIDREVQFVAESACKAALEETSSQRCTIVALDPDTFEIRALVVAPTFDPADRSGVDPAVFSNAAVRVQYEPGSTQKLVTVAAALEEGVVDAHTEFLVSDHIELVRDACDSNDDDITGCFWDVNKHDDTVMNVRQCVTVSSNVCTIMIQQKLGEQRLAHYLVNFGYGQATGIDFPGELPGSVKLDAGCTTCPASAAIGYSVSVTPLQMAAVYATIANDGVWMSPRLVTAVVDGQGRRQDIEPAQRRVVSNATARTMRVMLRSVVEEGTGTRAAVEGYSVGGKTGTTRRFVEGTGYTDQVVASFIGMAPIDDPQLVVAVVLDAPGQGFESGGIAAAPVFAQVIEGALQQMGVGPDA